MKVGVAHVESIAPVGFEGKLIEVESDIKNGLPSLQIVGLGNKAIDEAKERVRSAITNSHLEFPAKKLVINLAPAELPKDGTHYDLPIALAILISSGQLKQHEVHHSIFAGELALDGKIRPIKGVISIAEAAKQNGITQLYLPTENIEQAQLISDITIYGVDTLRDLYLHLKGEVPLKPATRESNSTNSTKESVNQTLLDHIHGQEQAKRALIIAASGRHNILFTGPPGAGKTMLAKTLLSLLPPLGEDEKITVTKLSSLAGETTDKVILERPFRSPHHTASRASLIGGGSRPAPGEISLAHLGVLFLDEIPEYPRTILEALRQPLEDKAISIHRAHGSARYPADFMLVATMNPCPCGYFGDNTRECSCSTTQILAYQKRLSGPLIDRIDMVVPVSRVPTNTLLHNEMSNLQHNNAKQKIQRASDAQFNRYKRSDIYNSSLSSQSVKLHTTLSQDAKELLQKAADKLQLSARAYFKTIKVAQTIADLEQAKIIQREHVAEALQYRHVTS